MQKYALPTLLMSASQSKFKFAKLTRSASHSTGTELP